MHCADNTIRAHAVRGSAGFVGDVAVLQQPDLVIDSMAAATGAAVAAMGAADSEASQQGASAAAGSAGAEKPAGTAGEGSGETAAAGSKGEGTQQQEPSTTDSKLSAARAEAAAVEGTADAAKGTAAAQTGRHPLEQRVCGSPAVDG